MNDDIEKAIYKEIPELNPEDPRSIHYNRKLNYNNDIKKELLSLLILFLINLLILYSINFFINNKIIFIVLAIFLFGFTMSKKVSITTIKIYQNTAPKKVRMQCRYEPSCSNYTLQLLEKKNLFKAIYMSINRIYKCSFTNQGGIDYPGL